MVIRMSREPPIQLTPAEEADLAEAEAEIERGELATPEDVRAMRAKHWLHTADKK
jgi:predicted transcriptional regulator